MSPRLAGRLARLESRAVDHPLIWRRTIVDPSGQESGETEGQAIRRWSTQNPGQDPKAVGLRVNTIRRLIVSTQPRCAPREGLRIGR